MKAIDIVSAILSVGTLIVEIKVLVNLWETGRILENKKESETEKVNTHSEIPKWVEKFIDEYMANAEKNSRH